VAPGVDATTECDLSDGKVRHCGLGCNVDPKQPKTNCGVGAVCHEVDFPDPSGSGTVKVGYCGFPAPNATATFEIDSIFN
jgi:hypothetical protein